MVGLSLLRGRAELFVDPVEDSVDPSEGGFAPLPTPPPTNRCAGKAGARTPPPPPALLPASGCVTPAAASLGGAAGRAVAARLHGPCAACPYQRRRGLIAREPSASGFSAERGLCQRAGRLASARAARGGNGATRPSPAWRAPLLLPGCPRRRRRAPTPARG